LPCVTEEDGARDVDKAVGELGVRPPVLGLLFDEQALVLPEINLEGFGFAGDEGRRADQRGGVDIRGVVEVVRLQES
jgi:hypothetical protein